MGWTEATEPTGYTVWLTDGGGDPWQAVAGHVHCGAAAPLTLNEALAVAQGLREVFPDALVLVRHGAGGAPPLITAEPAEAG